MTADGVFDIGLQPERTLLAWRRTCLALGVAGAIGARLTVGELGAAGIFVGLLAVALALVGYVAAFVRYRAGHRALMQARRLPAAGPAVTALSIGASGIALLAVLSLVLISW